MPVSVVMLAVCISTSTCESSGRSAIVTVPSNSVNRPRTLDSMCRATNSSRVWDLSKVHVPAGGSFVWSII